MNLFVSASNIYYNNATASKAYLNGTEVWSRISPTPPVTVLYSNFEQYIINGTRQASTSAIVRTNVSITQRLIVTSTISVTGFRFVRIPPDNWASTTGYNLSPTLSIVSGSGATIDGLTASKTFTSQSVVYNPLTGRTGGTTQYDIYTMRPTNLSTTILTAGQYNITLFGTSANMSMATLTNSTFPINTTGTIYPSSAILTFHLVMQVF